MKARGMILSVVTLIFVIALIPVIVDSTQDYNLLTVTESFTATEVLATPETFTTANDVETVKSVEVNNVAVVLTTDYTVSGNDITLLANETDVGDVVEITYDYYADVSTGVSSIMGIFVTVTLVGVLSYTAYNLIGKKN